ncbi:MAG: 7-cyano-7-deazaguanine synthase [Nanoarchaeota archaeon]|nr:7-cyano-7-deazaguanine synthase [Nanoarchaeota archaeon]MBU1031171.1 7-cyano-7-deazaguanine synthase [Nanoarchaeota archaeon]MBU1849670.1 7-cyano-7-deazaguanine synthase [Nanoarchaeota archaeon]
MSETVEEIRRRVNSAQKNYQANIQKINNILMAERGFISRTPKDEDVVMLCSGGLDSIVMVDKVISEWNSRVHLLFFKRGARAEKHEEEAFDYFELFYKRKYSEKMGAVKKFDYQIPPKSFKNSFPKEWAQTIGHPLRNSTMQNLAVNYAAALNGKYDLNIKTILSGSVAEDGTEPELGLLSLRTQTLNTCVQMGDWEWQITSPMTDPELVTKPIYKTDLIIYAMNNFIPLDRTRTCFSSDEKADGTCFACKKRLKAFEDAGMKDSLEYRRDD